MGSLTVGFYQHIWNIPGRTLHILDFSLNWFLPVSNESYCAVGVSAFYAV